MREPLSESIFCWMHGSKLVGNGVCVDEVCISKLINSDKIDTHCNATAVEQSAIGLGIYWPIFPFIVYTFYRVISQRTV